LSLKHGFAPRSAQHLPPCGGGWVGVSHKRCGDGTALHIPRPTPLCLRRPPTPAPSPQGGGRRWGTLGASLHAPGQALASTLPPPCGEGWGGGSPKLCAGDWALTSPPRSTVQANACLRRDPDHAWLCSLPLPPTWWRGPGTRGRLRNNKRRSRVPGAGASGRGVLASTTDDSLSGLASDPLRPEGRTIPPLPAVPSVCIVRRDDRTMRKG